MCQSLNSSLVRRTIDLNYANKQRAASLKWLFINGALLAVLTYDLWSWCGGCGGLACAEALGALVLAASCAQHAARLARSPRGAAQPLSPAQQRLLGLRDSDLDSSFVVRSACSTPERSPEPREEPGSLSPRRSWRARDSPPSPSPPSPPLLSSRGSAQRADPDEFISDGRALAAYIRQAEARAAGAGAGAGAGSARALPAPARAHQLAVLPERSKETSEEEGVGGGGAGGAPVWRQLHVDPQRLTEYNLNLRLWLHVTVVGRVARELAAAEAVGGVGAGAGAGAGGRHDALQPFLAPFADKQYVANRIKELSRGGCLSAYRWDGGGRGWRADSARPPDAELLLQLFAAYVDLVAPGGAFAARHVSCAPAAAPRAPLAPVLRRVALHPPHYVLLLRGATLEVGAGRNNLLHALLLFLAAAARARPPALCRLHLGPAGLNMLWILGR